MQGWHSTCDSTCYARHCPLLLRDASGPPTSAAIYSGRLGPIRPLPPHQFLDFWKNWLYLVVTIYSGTSHSCVKMPEIEFTPVQRLLRQGIRPSPRDLLDSSPLLAAAKEGHYEIVRLLLESGACVAEQDRYQRTASYWAARGGHIQATRELLPRSAIVDNHNRDDSRRSAKPRIELACYEDLNCSACMGFMFIACLALVSLAHQGVRILPSSTQTIDVDKILPRRSKNVSNPSSVSLIIKYRGLRRCLYTSTFKQRRYTSQNTLYVPSLVQLPPGIGYVRLTRMRTKNRHM